VERGKGLGELVHVVVQDRRRIGPGDELGDRRVPPTEQLEELGLLVRPGGHARCRDTVGGIGIDASVGERSYPENLTAAPDLAGDVGL
jgi:hypothetical protein